jgi:dihydrofolate reductase
VGALIGAGLVDELNVMIEPITLGGGKRIFPEDGSARPWRLTKSVTAGTGVLVCTYVPAS